MKRQQQWQLKMVAQGRCMNCAKPLNKYCVRCDSCAVKERERQRRRLGFKKWKPNKPGRPPHGSNYKPQTRTGQRYRIMKGIK